MKPHYHCNYRLSPFEVRMRLGRVIGCPWHYQLLFVTVYEPDGGNEMTCSWIGLN